MSIEQLRQWVNDQMRNARRAAQAEPYSSQENWEVGQAQAYKTVLKYIDEHYSNEEEG